MARPAELTPRKHINAMVVNEFPVTKYHNTQKVRGIAKKNNFFLEKIDLIQKHTYLQH